MKEKSNRAISEAFRFSKGKKKKSGVSTVIGTLIFLLVLMMGFTTVTTIFNYYNNYNSQLLQYDQSVSQEEQTSVRISSVSFGANSNTLTTSTASLTAYIPITLTNSQLSATP